MKIPNSPWTKTSENIPFGNIRAALFVLGRAKQFSWLYHFARVTISAVYQDISQMGKSKVSQSALWSKMLQWFFITDFSINDTFPQQLWYRWISRFERKTSLRKIFTQFYLSICANICNLSMFVSVIRSWGLILLIMSCQSIGFWFTLLLTDLDSTFFLSISNCSSYKHH